jgi:hypothetical protein
MLLADGSFDLNARYVFEHNTNDVFADAMYYTTMLEFRL